MPVFGAGPSKGGGGSSGIRKQSTKSYKDKLARTKKDGSLKDEGELKNKVPFYKGEKEIIKHSNYLFEKILIQKTCVAMFGVILLAL